jgi:hypothetical protein
MKAAISTAADGVADMDCGMQTRNYPKNPRVARMRNLPPVFLPVGFSLAFFPEIH